MWAFGQYCLPKKKLCTESVQCFNASILISQCTKTTHSNWTHCTVRSNKTHSHWPHCTFSLGYVRAYRPIRRNKINNGDVFVHNLGRHRSKWCAVLNTCAPGARRICLCSSWKNKSLCFIFILLCTVFVCTHFLFGNHYQMNKSNLSGVITLWWIYLNVEGKNTN